MGYKFNIFEKPIQAVHFSWFVQNRSRFEHWNKRPWGSPL
jgi:hypothetical protein